MDEDSQEMYLQNLEEFVLDEDKIVTYKWLSKTLNIHVNQSKQLLYTFWSSKGKAASVHATYLLAGRLRSTGENRVIVVGQDKYEDTKSSFEMLTSEHVYSVQKSKQTPSGSTLFTADSQPIEGECIASRGAIRCKESVRRAAEELALLRVTVPPPASTSVAKPLKAASSSAASKEPVKTSPAKPKPDENQKESAAKDAKPKGGLAAMFAAQTTKAATKPASGATSSKNNAKGKKGPGISNFFSKVSKEEMAEKEKAEKEKADKAKASREKDISPAKGSKEKDTSPAKVRKVEAMDIESDDDAMPSKPSVAVKQEEKKTDSDSKTKNKNTPKASKQTKQKRGKTKEKKDEPKKRKRIVAQVSDSSDEDIFAEEKNPSSREASPEPVLRAKPLESDEDDDDVIPPTPVAETSNGRIRRRRKVTKDKTYLDENGYMVTEKVNEYESFSESDTENADSKRNKGPSKPDENVDKESPPSSSKSKNIKGKVPAKKASPVTSKSPLKSKQQSLMNFFKKKD